MKKFALALIVGLSVSSAVAGGELPAYYPPAPLPVYQQVYVPQAIVVERPSVFKVVRTYFVNRGHDALDIVSPSVDFVAGIATFDPEHDDNR